MTARMEIVERKPGESFMDALARQNQRMPYTCAINGPMYRLSAQGWATVGLGNVDPKEVSPRGLMVRQGAAVAGQSMRDMFYVAYDYLGGYTFGFGDPAVNSARAVGGLGPLIIDGVPYGTTTLCKLPANCKPKGPPPPGMAGHMIQRSNATFAAFQQLPPATGKAILATNKELQRLLVCVQPQGGAGMAIEAVKLWLLSLGCDNAVFMDGSDSVVLHARGTLWAQPGILKNRGNTLGLAFYS